MQRYPEGNGHSSAIALRPARDGSPSASPLDEYRRWNNVLAQFFLLSAHRDDDVFLSVTPGLLAKALDDVENVILTPDDAYDDFKRSVSALYSYRVIQQHNPLRCLADQCSDGLPESIAFLGLSVLAAYDQERGEEATGRLRYYEPLAELLGCGLVGQYPKGFDPQQFDELWDLLGFWLLDRTGALLFLGRRNRQHTAQPRQHALLRRVDIAKLPILFESHSFEPGSRSVSPERLGRALDGFGRLTRDARSALGDKRRRSVIEQATTQLESWDGSVSDPRGTVKSSIQIQLLFRGDEPIFFFLPSRPSRFPDTFQAAEVRLESTDGPYYEPVKIQPTAGSALLHGFEWRSAGLTLRRPGVQVLALSPARDLSGFVSQPGLRRGVRSAVLCADGVRDEVAAFLTAITGRQTRSYAHPAVPHGWTLFADVLPQNAVPPPPGLDALEVSDAVTVEFVGGLRVGPSRSWLAGAPPTVVVSGPANIRVTVDSQPFPLVDGEIRSDALSEVGRHTIRVGRVLRTMEIVQPQVDQRNLAPLIVTSATGGWRIPIPRGQWALLGSQPDEVLLVASRQVSSVADCPFPPVWAVVPGNERGRRSILSLTQHPIAAANPRRRANSSLWAECVRNAQQHFGGFDSFEPEPVREEDLHRVWNGYRQSARSVKRSLKRTKGSY